MTNINRYSATLAKVETFINRFLTFQEEGATLPIALWIVATFLYTDFDAFPYVVITSETKRSGKTRLAEIMSFTCSNPVNTGALTPAAIYKTMAEEKPTLFFDEAESLSRQAANAMRAVLNMGYRRGSVVRRVVGEEVKEYQTYCPKVFVLIGDVHDTLRDRSIIIRMKRAEPKERFTYEACKSEGAALRKELAQMVSENRSAMIDFFASFAGIDFLTDRDEEIWSSLFTVCTVLFPERLKELQRIAVDMCMEKTQQARRYVELIKAGAETAAQNDEYRQRLLNDMLLVLDGKKWITTVDALAKLYEIDTAPWRKFRGEGLTMHNIGDMLSTLGVRSKDIKIDSKKNKVAKGYRIEDIKKALQ